MTPYRDPPPPCPCEDFGFQCENCAPELLEVPEVAVFLRTTPKAIYSMVERGALPGVVRIGRRVLVRRDDLRKHYGLLNGPPSNDSARKRA